MAAQPDISAVILKANAALEDAAALRDQVERRWKDDDTRFAELQRSVEEQSHDLSEFMQEFRHFKEASLDMHEGHLRLSTEQKQAVLELAKYAAPIINREKVKGAWRVVFNDTKSTLLTMAGIAGAITTIVVAVQYLR